VRDGSGQQRLQNIGEAVFQGVECEGHWWVESLRLSVTYTYLDAENRTAGAAIPHVEFRPGHLFNASFSADLPLSTAFTLEAAYVGRQYALDPDAGTWYDLSPYWLFHARIGYSPLQGVSLYARVNNVADRYYESERGYPQPGRVFLLGASALF